MTGMTRIEKEKFSKIKTNQKQKWDFTERWVRALFDFFLNFKVNVKLNILIIYAMFDKN